MIRPATWLRQRDLIVFRSPTLWVRRPYLPVVRRAPDGAGQQLGVLVDARGAYDCYGFSATVFLTLCGTPHNVSYADSAVMRSWWM